MCNGCSDRVLKLHELVYRFEDMAERCEDPLERAKLRHTAIDLDLLARELGTGCSGCAEAADSPPLSAVAG